MGIGSVCGRRDGGGGVAINVRMTTSSKTNTNDKKEVQEYFNGTGFSRWSRIYSDATDINRVQVSIREGHAQTVETILKWLSDEKATTASVLDAGCGVGSLSHPLSIRGHPVHGIDISAAMVAEAQTKGAKLGSSATFAVGDVDELPRHADIVCCVDVLIHYPTEDAMEMIGRLAKFCDRRLILSFAPSTPFLDLLKAVGSFFPGASKATRAYLHKEVDVKNALKKYGFQVQRSTLCKTNFYFSQVIDAVRM